MCSAAYSDEQGGSCMKQFWRNAENFSFDTDIICKLPLGGTL